MFAAPTQGAVKALKRVLGYISTTRERQLIVPRVKSNVWTTYSDSDHAGDMSTIGGAVLCLLFPLAVRAHIKPDGPSHGCLTSWASGSRISQGLLAKNKTPVWFFCSVKLSTKGGVVCVLRLPSLTQLRLRA